MIMIGVLPAFASDIRAAESDAVVNVDYEFAINLMSTAQPVDAYKIDNLELFSQYRLYTTSISVDGNSWNRLRLGLFESKQEALTAMKQVLGPARGR